jgi:hypothetical protein
MSGYMMQYGWRAGGPLAEASRKKKEKKEMAIKKKQTKKTTRKPKAQQIPPPDLFPVTDPMEAARAEAHRTLAQTLTSCLRARWSAAGLGESGTVAAPASFGEGPEQSALLGLRRTVIINPIVVQVSKTQTAIAVLDGADQSTRLRQFLAENQGDLVVLGAL